MTTFMIESDYSAAGYGGDPLVYHPFGNGWHLTLVFPEVVIFTGQWQCWSDGGAGWGHYAMGYSTDGGTTWTPIPGSEQPITSSDPAADTGVPRPMVVRVAPADTDPSTPYQFSWIMKKDGPSAPGAVVGAHSFSYGMYLKPGF